MYHEIHMYSSVLYEILFRPSMKITNGFMQPSFTQLWTTVNVPSLMYEVWRVTKNNRRTEGVEMSFLRSAAGVRGTVQIINSVQLKHQNTEINGGYKMKGRNGTGFESYS
jgi:hypothetical protein